MKHEELVTRLEGVVSDWKKYRDKNNERAEKTDDPVKEAKHIAKADVYNNNAALLQAILGDLETEE